jgi:DNA-directed RNA polymerase beta' subunit
VSWVVCRGAWCAFLCEPDFPAPARAHLLTCQGQGLARTLPHSRTSVTLRHHTISAKCLQLLWRPLPPSPWAAYIRLELPVFHVGYFKNTIQLLQCICKSCSRVLLFGAERATWLKWVRQGLGAEAGWGGVRWESPDMRR